MGEWFEKREGERFEQSRCQLIMDLLNSHGVAICSGDGLSSVDPLSRWHAFICGDFSPISLDASFMVRV